jgi:hypothetical protein
MLQGTESASGSLAADAVGASYLRLRRQQRTWTIRTVLYLRS